MRELNDTETSAVAGGSRYLRLIPAPAGLGPSAGFPNPPEINIINLPSPIVIPPPPGMPPRTPPEP